MRPTALKLLRQEPVTKAEWQDLFSAVHSVCLWDDKGPHKMYQSLQEDILEFIKHAQSVRQSCSSFYVLIWKMFKPNKVTVSHVFETQ